MRTFVLFNLLISFYSYGQKEIVDQTSLWLNYTGDHELSKKWSLHTDLQLRSVGNLKEKEQALVRFGIDYKHNDWQIAIGYAYSRVFPYGKQPITHITDEQRIWQQFVIKNGFERFEIQHRYRLEQRFLEKWLKETSGDFYQHGFVFRQRIRYRLMFTVPLTHKKMVDKTMFLNISDEIFLGFGKGVGKNVLDQNRLYIGLGWRFNRDFNIQVGYLNQYVIKSDGIKVERNQTLLLGVIYNFDFSK